jgi:flavin-binding protein dodecin
MAVVKVIELLAQSDKSWEEATNEALKEASKTVNNIQAIYINDLKAIVEENKVVAYRVNAKVSFVVGS